MSIQVLPAGDADMARLFDICCDAFLRNEPFWDACYPYHWTDAGRQIGRERFLAVKQNDPQTTFLKAVDTSTGTICGMAKWNVFQDRIPPRAMATGDYWESEDEKQYAQHLMDEFNRDRFAHVKAEGGNVVNLDILTIDPAFQRRGIGGQLVQWGTDKADELDFEAIVESSVFGKGLYEKAGFVWQHDVELSLGRWHGQERKQGKHAWLVRPRRSEKTDAKDA